MQVKRALRAAAVVSALAALAACGLDVLATGGASPGGDDDGAVDGGVAANDGAAGDTGAADVAPVVPEPIADAGLDVSPANCAAACPTAGGTCDGGWCTFDCAANNSCNGRIVCPPGVPCDVRCGGNESCRNGVDGTRASAAHVVCTGNDTCGDMKAGVDCSGASCHIECLGARACEESVSCDAGTCLIDCPGDRACANVTRCTGESCTLNCGKAGDTTASFQCRDGIHCDTTRKCEINCLGGNACRLGDVAARSGGSAVVRCSGNDACAREIFLSGAGDAGVLCTGTATCDGTAYCDAGTCAATCNSDDMNFCCTNPATCTKTPLGCNITTNNCP